MDTLIVSLIDDVILRMQECIWQSRLHGNEANVNDPYFAIRALSVGEANELDRAIIELFVSVRASPPSDQDFTTIRQRYELRSQLVKDNPSSFRPYSTSEALLMMLEHYRIARIIVARLLHEQVVGSKKT